MMQNLKGAEKYEEIQVVWLRALNLSEGLKGQLVTFLFLKKEKREFIKYDISWNKHPTIRV